MGEKGGGCLKAALITGGLVAFACAVLVGACVILVKSTPTPPPTTLSAAAQRLGGELTYCPGSGLPGLGLRRAREIPPCPVEMYLGRTLKDPTSYEADPGIGKRACSASAGKDVWLVDCTYRARNSFGAMVRHSQRFHVKGSAVLKVEDARP
jgi:hypothetical protein